MMGNIVTPVSALMVSPQAYEAVVNVADSANAVGQDMYIMAQAARVFEETLHRPDHRSGFSVSISTDSDGVPLMVPQEMRSFARAVNGLPSGLYALAAGRLLERARFSPVGVLGFVSAEEAARKIKATLQPVGQSNDSMLSRKLICSEYFLQTTFSNSRSNRDYFDANAFATALDLKPLALMVDPSDLQPIWAKFEEAVQTNNWNNAFWALRLWEYVLQDHLSRGFRNSEQRSDGKFFIGDFDLRWMEAAKESARFLLTLPGNGRVTSQLQDEAVEVFGRLALLGGNPWATETQYWIRGFFEKFDGGTLWFGGDRLVHIYGGVLFRQAGVVPSSVTERATLALLDLARNEKLPWSRRWNIFALALWTLEKFVPDGHEIAYHWVMREVTYSPNPGMVYGLANLYSAPLSRDGDTKPPRLEQQRRVIEAALRRNDPARDLDFGEFFSFGDLRKRLARPPFSLFRRNVA